MSDLDEEVLASLCVATAGKEHDVGLERVEGARTRKESDAGLPYRAEQPPSSATECAARVEEDGLPGVVLRLGVNWGCAKVVGVLGWRSEWLEVALHG